MEASIQLIQPIIVLVIWSMVMWVWMYATRLPAIAAMKMQLDPHAPNGQQMSQLPAKVRWKADNYNHLMEQPTIFYATVFALILLGVVTSTTVYAAWAYVGIRIVHSLVQALTNMIEARFTVFVLSNIPLAILIYMAARAAF